MCFDTHAAEEAATTLLAARSPSWRGCLSDTGFIRIMGLESRTCRASRICEGVSTYILKSSRVFIGNRQKEDLSLMLTMVT